MQRIVDVDPETAVQVLRGVGDALAAVGRPELGDRDLVGRRKSLGDALRGLPRGQPDRLGVDVGVRGALRDGLEARDRVTELLARRRVLGGHAQRPLAHADLHDAQRGERVLDGPGDDAGAVDRIAQRLGRPAPSRSTWNTGSPLVATSRVSVTPSPPGRPGTRRSRRRCAPGPACARAVRGRDAVLRADQPPPVAANVAHASTATSGRRCWAPGARASAPRRRRPPGKPAGPLLVVAELGDRCAATVVGTVGTGATVRPTCSRTRQVSRKPRPPPPYASGRPMPSRPASASACHAWRSNHSSVASISGSRSCVTRSLEDLGREVADRPLVVAQLEVQRLRLGHSRDARHPETEERDQVALHLVGPAAEGQEQGALVGALDPAAQRDALGEPRAARPPGR